MTNSNLTLISALLDRSGSMQTSKMATEDGWRELIDAQCNQPGECRVSLAQFDTEFETVYRNKAVEYVPRLNLQPRGATALLDAMGHVITDTGATLAAMPEHQRPGHVICLVMTDGMENSSVEYTWERINRMVTHQRAAYKWEFIFIGANMDAIAVGNRLGVPRGSTITYNDDSYVGTVAVAASAGQYISKTRAGGQNVSFTSDDRDAALGKGK